MPSRREITFLGTLGSDWCEWKGAIWSWGNFLKIGSYSQVSKFLSTSLVKVVRFFNGFFLAFSKNNGIVSQKETLMITRIFFGVSFSVLQSFVF